MTRYLLVPLLLGGLLFTGQQGCETDDDEDGWFSCTTGEDPTGGTCDCDDSEEDINPDAEEICEDGVDQNCDGLDEECPSTPTPTATPVPTPIDPLGCIDVELESAIGDAVYTGVLTGATGDFRSDCGGTGNEVALSFTAPERAIFTFDTIGSAIDTVLYVREESCQGREIECNDDASGFQSALSVELRRGEEVVVFIDSYATNTGGNVVLNITQEAEATATPGTPTETPDNTPTTSPTDVEPLRCVEVDLGTEVGEDVYVGEVAADTGNFNSTCGGTTGNEVVFAWEAAESGEYTITTFGTTYDTVLYAKAGTCLGDSIGCNDDTGGLQSSLTVEAEAGETIVIFADAYSATTGAGTLHLNILPPVEETPTQIPTETEIPTPTDIPDPLGCVDIELDTATGPAVYTGEQTAQEGDHRGSCGGNGNETVFHWIAPADGEYTIDTYGTSYDTVLYALEGSCTGEQIACNDDSGGTQSSITATFSAGDDVIIFLDAYYSSASGSGTAVLNITAPVVDDTATPEPTPTATPPEPTVPPAPGNTLCVDHNLGNEVGVNIFADYLDNDVSYYSGTCGGNGNELIFLWYAPEAGTYVIDTLGSTADTVLFVRAGGCDGEEVGCNDDYESGVYQSAVTATVQQNDYLTIFVDSYDVYTEGELLLSITQ